MEKGQVGVQDTWELDGQFNSDSTVRLAAGVGTGP